jgi:hypothetical protein
VPSKRGVVVLVLACALAVAVAVRVNSRASSGRFHYAPDEVSARQLAQQACATLDEFVALVDENGSARQATSLLERFEAKAEAAYAKDVRWTRLLSAAKALQAGFDADDARATRVGYDIAREECRQNG